ncbi:MAG: hypothetical protein HXP24_07750, partial [Veillonella sp.]|nr:hypothetical protein [Veillonella sp.]
MSVLTVSNVTHGFGARQILDDASFRLLKGEHVGLIGANVCIRRKICASVVISSA